ncbi:MAG: toxin-antitoxin system YwqK family antitoxin [Bacteroidales bacterium]|nr:toxin-antitoxin system YwqK family antitoxin [Bacteroidales bacterium]
MRQIIITLSVLLIPFFGYSQDSIIENNGKYYTQTGALFTGLHQTWYSNSTIKSELPIAEGLLNGEVKIYLETGKLNETRQYAKGIKNGKWETWNADGRKISEAHFLNGQKHGQWKIWDDAGNLRYDMTYTNGKKSGLWIIYNEQGEKVSQKEY